MNRKIDQLFTAARRESSPGPDPNFASLVLAAIRREQLSRGPEFLPPLEQISAWAPRLAFACAIVLGVCLGLELFGSGWGAASLANGVAALANDWLLTLNLICA